MTDTSRKAPYGAFNFIVQFTKQNISARFSDVSGLNTELTISEYRDGNYRLNNVQKISGLNKTGDVTLKRGLIDSEDFWAWIREVRKKGVEAQRTVTITLRDETGENAVQAWVLRGTVPMKWTGPTLAAKTHSDVAMEELVLSAEEIDYQEV